MADADISSDSDDSTSFLSLKPYDSQITKNKRWFTQSQGRGPTSRDVHKISESSFPNSEDEFVSFGFGSQQHYSRKLSQENKQTPSQRWQMKISLSKGSQKTHRSQSSHSSNSSQARGSKSASNHGKRKREDKSRSDILSSTSSSQQRCTADTNKRSSIFGTMSRTSVSQSPSPSSSGAQSSSSGKLSIFASPEIKTENFSGNRLSLRKSYKTPDSDDIQTFGSQVSSQMREKSCTSRNSGAKLFEPDEKAILFNHKTDFFHSQKHLFKNEKDEQDEALTQDIIKGTIPESDLSSDNDKPFSANKRNAKPSKKPPKKMSAQNNVSHTESKGENVSKKQGAANVRNTKRKRVVESSSSGESSDLEEIPQLSQPAVKSHCSPKEECISGKEMMTNQVNGGSQSMKVEVLNDENCKEDKPVKAERNESHKEETIMLSEDSSDSDCILSPPVCAQTQASSQKGQSGTICMAQESKTVTAGTVLSDNSSSDSDCILSPPVCAQTRASSQEGQSGTIIDKESNETVTANAMLSDDSSDSDCILSTQAYAQTQATSQKEESATRDHESESNKTVNATQSFPSDKVQRLLQNLKKSKLKLSQAFKSVQLRKTQSSTSEVNDLEVTNHNKLPGVTDSAMKTDQKTGHGELQGVPDSAMETGQETGHEESQRGLDSATKTDQKTAYSFVKHLENSKVKLSQVFKNVRMRKAQNTTSEVNDLEVTNHNKLQGVTDSSMKTDQKTDHGKLQGVLDLSKKIDQKTDHEGSSSMTDPTQKTKLVLKNLMKGGDKLKQLLKKAKTIENNSSQNINAGSESTMIGSREDLSDTFTANISSGSATEPNDDKLAEGQCSNRNSGIDISATDRGSPEVDDLPDDDTQPWDDVQATGEDMSRGTGESASSLKQKPCSLHKSGDSTIEYELPPDNLFTKTAKAITEVRSSINSSGESNPQSRWPFLSRTSSDSNLSQEIPDQDTVMRTTAQLCLQNPKNIRQEASSSTSFVKETSLPHLDKVPSHISERDIREQSLSPPMLTQYLMNPEISVESPDTSRDSIPLLSPINSVRTPEKTGLTSTPGSIQQRRLQGGESSDSKPDDLDSQTSSHSSAMFSQDNTMSMEPARASIQGKITDVLSMLDSDVDMPDKTTAASNTITACAETDKAQITQAGSDMPAGYGNNENAASGSLSAENKEMEIPVPVGNFSISVAAPAADIDQVVVKEEIIDKDEDIYSNSCYAEIDDVVHVFDSEDEELFMTQSILDDPSILEEELLEPSAAADQDVVCAADDDGDDSDNTAVRDQMHEVAEGGESPKIVTDAEKARHGVDDGDWTNTELSQLDSDDDVYLLQTLQDYEEDDTAVDYSVDEDDLLGYNQPTQVISSPNDYNFAEELTDNNDDKDPYNFSTQYDGDGDDSAYFQPTQVDDDQEPHQDHSVTDVISYDHDLTNQRNLHKVSTSVASSGTGTSDVHTRSAGEIHHSTPKDKVCSSVGSKMDNLNISMSDPSPDSISEEGQKPGLYSQETVLDSPVSAGQGVYDMETQDPDMMETQDLYSGQTLLDSPRMPEGQDNVQDSLEDVAQGRVQSSGSQNRMEVELSHGPYSLETVLGSLPSESYSGDPYARDTLEDSDSKILTAESQKDEGGAEQSRGDNHREESHLGQETDGTSPVADVVTEKPTSPQVQIIADNVFNMQTMEEMAIVLSDNEDICDDLYNNPTQMDPEKDDLYNMPTQMDTDAQPAMDKTHHGDLKCGEEKNHSSKEAVSCTANKDKEKYPKSDDTLMHSDVDMSTHEAFAEPTLLYDWEDDERNTSPFNASAESTLPYVFEDDESHLATPRQPKAASDGGRANSENQATPMMVSSKKSLKNDRETKIYSQEKAGKTKADTDFSRGKGNKGSSRGTGCEEEEIQSSKDVQTSSITKKIAEGVGNLCFPNDYRLRRNYLSAGTVVTLLEVGANSSSSDEPINIDEKDDVSSEDNEESKKCDREVERKSKAVKEQDERKKSFTQGKQGDKSMKAVHEKDKFVKPSKHKDESNRHVERQKDKSGRHSELTDLATRKSSSLYAPGEKKISDLRAGQNSTAESRPNHDRSSNELGRNRNTTKKKDQAVTSATIAKPYSSSGTKKRHTETKDEIAAKKQKLNVDKRDRLPSNQKPSESKTKSVAGIVPACDKPGPSKLAPDWLSVNKGITRGKVSTANQRRGPYQRPKAKTLSKNVPCRQRGGKSAQQKNDDRLSDQLKAAIREKQERMKGHMAASSRSTLRDQLMSDQVADENDDVEFPCTQEVIDLGLPINEQRLISKKDKSTDLWKRRSGSATEKGKNDVKEKSHDGRHRSDRQSHARRPPVPLFDGSGDQRPVSESGPAVSSSPASVITAGQKTFQASSSTTVLSETSRATTTSSASWKGVSVAHGEEVAVSKTMNRTSRCATQPVTLSSPLVTASNLQTTSASNENINSTSCIPATTVCNSKPSISTSQAKTSTTSVSATDTLSPYKNLSAQPAMQVATPVCQPSRAQTSVTISPALSAVPQLGQAAGQPHKGVLRDKSVSPHRVQTSKPSVSFNDAKNMVFHIDRNVFLPGPQDGIPPRPLQLSSLPNVQMDNLPVVQKPKVDIRLKFLSRVLHWPPKWLHEQGRNSDSIPPLFGQNYYKALLDGSYLTKLRIFYETYEEYTDIMSRLLVVEAWEAILRDWKTLKERRKLDIYLLGKPTPPSTEGAKEAGLLNIDVITVLSESERPKQDDIVILEVWGVNKMNVKTKDPEWYTQFAQVKKVDVLNRMSKEGFLHSYKLFAASPALKERNLVFVKMTLGIRHKGVPINQKLFKLEVISSLTTNMRQHDALMQLPSSPLCRHFLRPGPDSVFCHNSAGYLQSQAAQSGKCALNREQTAAVTTISHAVVSDQESRKIFVLQGPPGTGKSRTICDLIYDILKKTEFKARICLATPSNAAVDEVARRLIQMSGRLRQQKHRDISVVRVGAARSVHRDVQAYTWDKLVDHYSRTRAMPESVRSELKSKKREADELSYSLKDATPQQKIIRKQKLTKCLESIRRQEQEIAKTAKITPRQTYEAQCHVLDNGHVICGTLNSFGSPKLQQILLRSDKNYRHVKHTFTCLIIDEATQAVEVDCVIPLQYKINKMVLVGDLKQLSATVLSKRASDKDLGVSLFERLEKNFKIFVQQEKILTSPVLRLARQYRMHEEILSLPNSFFYDGELVTDESVRARTQPLAPYLVFDIAESRETRDGNHKSLANEDEANCAAHLCSLVMRALRESEETIHKRIGVICPYTEQKQTILNYLRRKRLGSIEVNTVDGFQGQERDVIIMSCVRAQGQPSGIGFVKDDKRMNVALTRAKLALYVLGHQDTLKTDELWQELYRDARERKLLVHIPKTAEFRSVAERLVCTTSGDSRTGRSGSRR